MISYFDQNSRCYKCNAYECRFNINPLRTHHMPANNIYDIPKKNTLIRGRFSKDKQAKIYSLQYKFWFFSWFYKWQTYHADGTKAGTVVTGENLTEWRYVE